MQGTKGAGYDEWHAKGQTAAEINAEYRNINSPENVVDGSSMIEAQFNNRTYVGTKYALLGHFKDYLDGKI